MHILEYRCRSIRPRFAPSSGLLLFAAAAALISSHAIALDSPSHAEGLAEIVVTAEKRSSTVQEVPVSITAYSGDQLLERGLVNLARVGQETPGVSMRDSGPGQTEFEMRGVSSSGGSSPTVGFYLDETPLTAPAYTQTGKVVIDPSLYDLNRIEILRGPQGTLYGSGSMGGTIKLVTNQPDPSAFGASGQAIGSSTHGGGWNYSGNAMVNIPLVQDAAALRLVGTSKHIDGWIDRIVANDFPAPTDGGMVRGDVRDAAVTQNFRRANSESLQGGRANLLIMPSERLTLTATFFYQRITQDGLSYADSPPGVGAEAHYQPFDVAEPFADTFSLGSVVGKYSFDSFDVTATAARYRRAQHVAEDSTETTQNFFESILEVPSPSYASVGALTTYEDDWSKQDSAELRITSTGTDPFQWLGGVFFQHFRSTDIISTNEPGPLVADTFGIPLLYAIQQRADLKQYAAFGEASYRFANKLKLTAGLRYFHYTANDFLSEAGALPNGSLTPSTFQSPASDSGTNPKINLSYFANEDLTLYAQVVKGYRPGATNTQPPESCPQDVVPLQYHPDSLWSYELGEKAQFFDNHLTVNGAAYYEKWRGIQQLVAMNCGFYYTANAGTARVYGGELEVAARLTPRLSLSTALGYTNARISQAEPGSSFYVGEKIQEVPAFTDTTTLTYRQPIGGDYHLVGLVSNVYVGSSTDVTFLVNDVPSRNIVNGRLGLASGGGMEIFLYVDNLTDKRAVQGNVNSQSFNVGTFNRVATNQPRTIGLDLTYRFGGPGSGK